MTFAGAGSECFETVVGDFANFAPELARLEEGFAGLAQSALFEFGHAGVEGGLTWGKNRVNTAAVVVVVVVVGRCQLEGGKSTT